MISEPIKDFGEGLGRRATKGALEYSEEKIKELVSLFRDKKLRFIGDEQTIKVAKETKKSGEWNFYKAYISDKELLFNILLGLVLRKVEHNVGKLQSLRDKIKMKYDVEGLHIAYFVQNGILNRYVAILLDNLYSTEKLEETIITTLKNLEKHVIFVDQWYDERRLLKESLTITSFNPSIFIVSSIFPASKIVKECSNKLIEGLKNYEYETMSTGKKEILFFKYVV